SVLGDVVDAVDRTGLRENTLIIATSDNGPQWFPKDVKKFDHRAAGPLRGMKGDAWEGGHRVPFVVRWPGVVEEDTESDQLFGLTDIYATFADILNRDLAPGEAPDSVSILPVLLGEDNGKPVREYLPIHGVSSLALLSNRWKFIPNRSHGGFFSRDSSVLPPDDAPEKQLYDLAEDLGEQNNLYLQRPDVARRMQEKLNEIRRLKHPEPASIKKAKAAEQLPEEEQIISWPSDEGEVIYRVNCGSDSDYKTEKGVSWSADQEYKPGETDWGFTGGGTVYRGRNRQIQWTKLDEIYRHERYHVPGYVFHVEDGRYTVRLHFAETYRFFNVGERVFDVYINEENVLPDFDAIGETGKRNRAVDKVIDDIEPIDGRIEITFKPKGSIINGIEIIKQ
ncbi:MAG: sulfatase-like hydrolase/transferase, partial [Planctomycetes bacterium]|nr:sulfatase-like hydrolase/transferase [Planctomycetota bacterium]